MDVLQDLEARGASSLEYQANYPATIRITDELVDHTRGLLRIFPTQNSLALPTRPTDRNKIRHHIGDASAEGFAAWT